MYTPQPLAEATQHALNQLDTPSKNGLSITRWIIPLGAMVQDDGVDLAVSAHYCGHCGTRRHRDNGSDGEADCEHKAFVRWAWDEAVFRAMMRQDDEDAAAYADENRERYAVMAGVG